MMLIAKLMKMIVVMKMKMKMTTMMMTAMTLIMEAGSVERIELANNTISRMTVRTKIVLRTL